MSLIWHGFNRDPKKRANQCYYEWNCLVCWLRTLAFVIRLGVRYRLAEIRVPCAACEGLEGALKWAPSSALPCQDSWRKVVLPWRAAAATMRL
jgi:hypothetical protein